jgi:hypothetical protein
MEYLLQIANAIAQRKRDETLQKLTRDQELEFEGEITKLSGKDIDKILDIIFPKGVPSDSNFYNLIEEVQYYAGFKPLSTTLVAHLWVNAYHRLSPDNRIILLKSLLDKNTGGFWTAIRSLPEFCSRIELEPAFTKVWFFELANRVKGDLAGGDVFKAVGKYAFHFPESGLKVFENYVSEGLDDLKLSLAAILLGTVRSRAYKKYIAIESIKKWDDQLQDSHITKFRICYHRSLIASFDLDALSIKELDVKLSRMLDGTQEEIGEAFNTVYYCLLGKLSDNNFVRFAVNWLSKNVSGQIPDLAKYCVVTSMWRLCNARGGASKSVDLTRANNLLAAIQPISNDNLGTWRQLEYYLVDRLHEGLASFEDIFTKLVGVNAEGLLAQLQEGEFTYLKSEMAKYNIEELVTNFLISTEHEKRVIGKFLFQEVKMSSLSQEVLSKADESQLKVALLEFIRQPFLGEKASQYLLFIEPYFRQVSPELQKIYKDEMVMQAINYPGACLEEWKKVSDPSDLLQDVIKTAGEYFDNLNRIKDSPATSFSFTDYKKATEKNYREFSSQIVRKAQEKSVFAQLAKNVQIVYGSRWSVYMEDKLGEDTSFSEFSSSMEFPRLEIIDPEGMALRRIQAAAKIRELNKSNDAN